MAGDIGTPVNMDNTNSDILAELKVITDLTSVSLDSAAAFNSRGSQRSPVGPAIPAPVGAETDRLTSDKKIRRHQRPSLQTWETALIQGIETCQDAEEVVQETLIGKRLVVREDEWYPVFRRDKRINCTGKTRGSDSFMENGHGARWSVDGPAVWRELRPCIELANRILGQAVRGPWCAYLVTFLV